MPRLLLGLLIFALAAPAFATDGALEINEPCAFETGCSAEDTTTIEAISAEWYRLTGDSAWLEGCIVGLCLCPVWLLDDLTGVFALVELLTFQPGPWRLFEVLDLRWTLGRGETQIEIRGRGLYRTAAPVLDEHRLVLDLEFDGDPIGTLDSGVVPGALSFPEINIQALTAGECYQEGVWLAAAPVPEPSQGSQQLAGLLALLLLSRRRNARRAWGAGLHPTERVRQNVLHRGPRSGLRHVVP